MTECKTCGPAPVGPIRDSSGCAAPTCTPSTPRLSPGCAPKSPVIEPRNESDLAAALAAARLGYTHEWKAPRGRGEAGDAFIGMLARELAIQGEGLNAMPLRLQLEFLERLGAYVLPAQSARAPLVFKLLDSATGDATVPAGTRVGAVLPPPPPSLDDDAVPPRVTPPEFFTEQEITAMRGKLAAVYSIDPAGDVYADHSAAAAGFALFTDMQPAPHRIYLGHDELFKFSGSAQIDLVFDFATAGTVAGVAARQRPLLFDWEYLSANGWLPLTLVEDRTERFTRDGKVVLAKRYGPDAKEDVVAGRSSFWIRGTVSSRVPEARICADPVAGVLEVEVEHTRELLPQDVVTVDGVSRATVVGTTGTRVLLDTMPLNVRSGEYLTLADALPPLRPDGADEEGVLPQVDVIRARVGFARDDLAVDSAYLDGFSVDTSKDFYPFGTIPQAFASFYIACKDAFSRSGARVELDLHFVKRGMTAGNADVQVEYFDGSRWTALGPDEEFEDETEGLTAATRTDPKGFDLATVSFVVPRAWEESSINGDRQFWLRLRLASGDYGAPAGISVVEDPPGSGTFVVKNTPANLRPPIVAELRVNYLVFSEPSPLDHCMVENDFAFGDRTVDARWPRSPFAPFVPVSDRTPALHLGFSAKPPAALVSLLALVTAPAEDAAAQPFVWDYWGSRGWTELSVRDATAGFKATGTIQFVGAPDALPREGLGGNLYRIRARLKPGFASLDYRAMLGGLWLNAVWASEGTRYVNDRLGTSNGYPDQTYALATVRAKPGSAPGTTTPIAANDVAEFNRALAVPATGVPVMAGEAVWVREWTGRGDDWETAVGGVPPEDLRFETDPRDPTVKTAAWVRWHARPHLYEPGLNRHYVVERARGIFRFPGAGGFIPPAGSPIAVTYVTGGGAAGNVAAGLVRELHSGVGFVESVTNPLAAGGGATAESLRNARDRGAQSPRNRDRAVSVEDYEWLARQASSEVARARALPLEGDAGRGARGFVGLVLVPHSADAAPMPSPELGARVLAYLRARVPAGIAGGLRIVAPGYVRVGVRAEIIPRVAEEAGRVEARVRARLGRFLHPVTGGRDGTGWDFGVPAYLSDLAALLEETAGVDAVPSLQLMVGSAIHGDHVPLGPHQIVAAGDSQLKIVVRSVPYALA